MNRRASRPSRRIPRIWLLPALTLTAILGLTAADVFSRSLVLDLVAWWPAWLGLVAIVALVGRRRVGRLRVEGLVSILVAAALVTFTVGHIQGWPLNPSSTRYLVGPEASGYDVVELTALVTGELRIMGGSEFLYEVDPAIRGGEVGIPSAVERSIGGLISVVLEAPANPGFDTSAGWDLTLSNDPRWALTLGGDVDLELTELAVDSLDVEGSGLIRLGAVGDTALVAVDGAFTVEVPAGSSARVVGNAQVPPTWTETSDGWRSPDDGFGWVITVPSGSVVSIDQS